MNGWMGFDGWMDVYLFMSIVISSFRHFSHLYDRRDNYLFTCYSANSTQKRPGPLNIVDDVLIHATYNVIQSEFLNKMILKTAN